jgi:hypothetical protein
MKNKRKLFILIIILILFSIFCSGCVSVIPGSLPDPELPFSPPNIGPTSGWLVIENNGPGVTKDCTPVLSIFSEEAVFMSFSGDRENWSEWKEYNTSYKEFNIASGLNGTEFASGEKKVYVRFKDEEGNLSPSDDLAFDTIKYEIAELFSIKIYPQKVTISIEESYTFTLHGYDYSSKNEVPLDGSKVTWTKCCDGVGNLLPTTGLSTTYTAPSIPGKRNITAHYGNLATGATISISK